MDDVIAELNTRALGAELKRTREDIGLSQTELVSRMPSAPHFKTYASYEQGARQCTVVMLCEICRALGVSVADLLTRVLLHVDADMQVIRLTVDIEALASDKNPDLRQLRRWAQGRLATYPRSTLARLSGDTIEEMAVVFKTTPIGLVDQLAPFALTSAPTTLSRSDDVFETGY